jgi:hypothetical protein
MGFGFDAVIPGWKVARRRASARDSKICCHMVAPPLRPSESTCPGLSNELMVDLG